MFFSPLIKKVLKLLPDSFYFPVLSGALRGIKWIPKSANPGQVVGRYEPEQTAVLVELLRESKVFWDVGAHAGWYSLLASKLIPDGRIACFEPNPENFAIIKNHIRINQVNNIDIFPVALCNETGSSMFSGKAQFGKLSSSGEYQVDTTTADQLSTEQNTVPDLIKLDIEGGELEFLKGARSVLSTHKPVILLSAHGYRMRDSCTDYLVRMGYQTELLVNNVTDGDYVLLAQRQKVL